jgi:hypothetical protein
VTPKQVDVATVIGSLGFHPQYKKSESAWKILLGLDWIGVLIITAAVTLTLVGFAQPFILPWSDPRVIGPLVSGLCMILVLVAWCTLLMSPVTRPTHLEAGKWKTNAIIRPSLFTFWNYQFAM